MSTWVVGPWSGNRSQRCHSEVMFGVGHRLEPGDEDGLVQVLRVAELGPTSREASQFLDNKQMTGDIPR